MEYFFERNSLDLLFLPIKKQMIVPFISLREWENVMIWSPLYFLSRKKGEGYAIIFFDDICVLCKY